MRSRLGMFAYYQKKGGWGAGPLTLPGGIGYQYTYLLTYLHLPSQRTAVRNPKQHGLRSLGPQAKESEKPHGAILNAEITKAL